VASVGPETLTPSPEIGSHGNTGQAKNQNKGKQVNQFSKHKSSPLDKNSHLQYILSSAWTHSLRLNKTPHFLQMPI